MDGFYLASMGDKSAGRAQRSATDEGLPRPLSWHIAKTYLPDGSHGAPLGRSGGMRTRQTLPRALQMGRGAEFATARLKNYPKDFCSALANISAAWNARYLNNFELATRSDTTFNEYVRSLVCRFNFDVQRGSDYAN